MSTYSPIFALSQVPIGALAERMRHKPLLVCVPLLLASAWVLSRVPEG